MNAGRYWALHSGHLAFLNNDGRPEQRWLSTTGFLDKVDENLK